MGAHRSCASVQSRMVQQVRAPALMPVRHMCRYVCMYSLCIMCAPRRGAVDSQGRVHLCGGEMKAREYIVVDVSRVSV